MENMESQAYNREALQAKITDLEHKIALKESLNETGPEVNELHKQHEELVAQMSRMDTGSDFQKAA